MPRCRSNEWSPRYWTNCGAGVPLSCLMKRTNHARSLEKMRRRWGSSVTSGRLNEGFQTFPPSSPPSPAVGEGMQAPVRLPAQFIEDLVDGHVDFVIVFVRAGFDLVFDRRD